MWDAGASERVIANGTIFTVERQRCCYKIVFIYCSGRNLDTAFLSRFVNLYSDSNNICHNLN